MNQLVLARPPGVSPRLLCRLSVVLKDVKAQWAAWRMRQRERAALLSLSDAELQDIGISRAQANFQYNRPFWRA